MGDLILQSQVILWPCLPPLEAYPPVLIRLKLVDWGTKGTRGCPVRIALRLRARGGPWRTAYTPALGRGYGVQEAQSPAANTWMNKEVGVI